MLSDNWFTSSRALWLAAVNRSCRFFLYALKAQISQQPVEFHRGWTKLFYGCVIVGLVVFLADCAFSAIVDPSARMIFYVVIPVCLLVSSELCTSFLEKHRDARCRGHLKFKAINQVNGFKS